MRLLATGGDGNSSLYAKEVVGDSGAVVPSLLRFTGDSTHDSSRCVLGLELFSHFIAVQNTSDYAKPIAKHIPPWFAFLLPSFPTAANVQNAHVFSAHGTASAGESCFNRPPIVNLAEFHACQEHETVNMYDMLRQIFYNLSGPHATHACYIWNDLVTPACFRHSSGCHDHLPAHATYAFSTSLRSVRLRPVLQAAPRCGICALPRGCA
jgi:hypothetical protein